MGVFNLCCVCARPLPSDQHFLYFEAAGVIITLFYLGDLWKVVPRDRQVPRLNA